MSETQQNVYKVTLSSKKVVLLRELRIKHRTLALQAASMRAGENQTVLGAAAQEELLKLLIVQVDGAAVPAAKLEDLDSLFSMKEFGQLMTVMGQLMGEDPTGGKAQVEIVTSG